MRGALLSALVLIAVVPGAALGQTAPVLSGGPTPAAVLRSVLIAPETIDYEGTKVISTQVVRPASDREIRPAAESPAPAAPAGLGDTGSEFETVTVLEAHKRPNQTRLEFLSPDSVAGRLVIDNGVEAWHYEPALHTAFQGPTLAATGAVDAALQGLQAAYRVEVLGAEEVIGRSAIVLSLTARAGGGRRLIWVDQATGVPLRTEERVGGTAVYAAYFTRISFSLNLPEALFRFRAPAGARTFALFPGEEPTGAPQGLQRDVRFRIRRPTSLPAGMREAGASLTRYGPLQAAHLRYTDGAAPISVFQAPARGLPRPQGRSVRLGGRDVTVMELGYFRAITWEDDAVRLTVIGAQPPAVLLALAGAFIR